MIGGADKYMATCRRCFHTNVKIPASPRPILQSTNNKENDLALCNTFKRKLGSGDKSAEVRLHESEDEGNFLDNGMPAKKALFEKDCDENTLTA